LTGKGRTIAGGGLVELKVKQQAASSKQCILYQQLVSDLQNCKYLDS